MDVPLEIRFHNMAPSDAIEARVRERVEKLNHLYDQLVACRVSIEAPHKQHRKGNVFTVHIDMSVPGSELVVSRGPHHPQEKYRDPDLYTVLNEAFEAAEKKVSDRQQQLMSIKGKQSVEELHKKLGKIMWEYCGMARTAEGLTKAKGMLNALGMTVEAANGYSD